VRNAWKVKIIYDFISQERRRYGHEWKQGKVTMMMLMWADVGVEIYVVRPMRG
jgi:hypothetical protein